MTEPATAPGAPAPAQDTAPATSTPITDPANPPAPATSTGDPATVTDPDALPPAVDPPPGPFDPALSPGRLPGDGSPVDEPLDEPPAPSSRSSSRGPRVGDVVRFSAADPLLGTDLSGTGIVFDVDDELGALVCPLVPLGVRIPLDDLEAV